jgi:hypothetical protein
MLMILAAPWEPAAEEFSSTTVAKQPTLAPDVIARIEARRIQQHRYVKSSHIERR